VPWAPDYVTVEELRSYSRIPDDVDDAELALAIAASSRAIDRKNRRQYGKVATPELRTYTACPVAGRWVVETDDFQTAAGLVVQILDVGKGPPDPPETVTTFTKEPVNAAQKGRPWTRLAFTANSEFFPTGARDEIAVTAPWGWTAVPEAIKQATLLQALRLATRRQAPFWVAGSPELGSELRLLERLDPDVAVAIRDYRRRWAVG